MRSLYAKGMEKVSTLKIVFLVQKTCFASRVLLLNCSCACSTSSGLYHDTLRLPSFPLSVQTLNIYTHIPFYVLTVAYTDAKEQTREKTFPLTFGVYICVTRPLPSETLVCLPFSVHHQLLESI